jgi:uncharacterized damage-inducible protein DinB
MQTETDFDQVVLEALKSRITKILPNQILSCVEELSEAELWWRPNAQSNSVGNLVLHLSGSMRHYVSRTIGGIEYERNRPAEFAEREHYAKEQVITIFKETISQVRRVLDNFETSRFLKPTPEQAYNPTVFNLLYNVSIHVATHTGQIVFVTKMLKEGSVDELWIRTHKEQTADKTGGG